MALDDTSGVMPGSIYGVDVPWPPPGFGLPAAPVEQTPAPVVVDPAASVPADPSLASAEPVPVAPAAPPELGEMPPDYVGRGAATPVPPLPGVPALGYALGDNAAPPTPPPPATEAATPAAPAVPDPQLAMFGVPSSPEQLAALAGQDQDARHAQYLDAVGQAGAAPPRLEGTDAEEIDREARYYAAHPFALAQKDQEDEHAAMVQARADKMKASAADERAQAQNLANVTKARQDAATARAQAAADAVNIAKLDPTRWMNKSTYNTVTGVIAAALGGLAQMQNGGRNIGLEQLNKNIDRDIEAQQNEQQQQRANISLRQSNTAANLADADANFVDREKYRASVYQRAMDEIQTKMQDFAPRSSAVRALAHQYQQIAAAQQMSFDKIQEADFNRNVKGLEAVGKYTSDMASARKSLAEAGKLEAKPGAGEGATLKAYGTVFPSFNEVPPKLAKLAFGLPTGGVILANNEESAKQGAALAEAYKAADIDLNKMQQLAVERNNAKSAGGQIWKKWQDTQEHEFDQLVIDFANTYGTTIHGGRPIPAGTLEEVMHVMPQLKGIFDGGDTAKEIDNLRDDVDNRMAGKFSVLSGSKVELKSNRPKPQEVNANTLVAPLREAPVKGASGYASIDVGNANQQLDAIAQHYAQTPTLGGNKGLAAEYDNIDATQHKAVSEISGEIAKLQAVKKRSPQQETQLKNNRKALADRQEVIKAIDDARKRHADVMGNAKAQAAWDDVANKAETDRESAFDPGF